MEGLQDTGPTVPQQTPTAEDRPAHRVDERSGLVTPLRAAISGHGADSSSREVEDSEHGRDAHAEDDRPAFTWVEAVRIAVTALCAAALFFQLPDDTFLSIGNSVFLPFSWYGVIGLVVGGWPLFREAYEGVLSRRMTMELSMGIAVLSAAYASYFFVALVITLFVLIAEILEDLTLDRGRGAIRDLMELLPQRVSVRRGQTVLEIGQEELRVGDVVVVAPGARIPVDGEVQGGNSFVDESRITGESMPVEKISRALVYAGSINQSGSLEIRADRIGRDTSYGQILDAVERAEKSRAPVQRLADRLAGYIVYVALGFAAFEYYITKGDISGTISVIVVAGACGVAAGTPLAILGGIGRAAKLGGVIKGGVHLETLGKVRTVVLDKTGTLTFGRPEVTGVHPQAGIEAADLLLAAANAELLSEHPIGKAVVAWARREGLEIPGSDSFSYRPGRGIAALVSGTTVLVGNAAWLSENGVELGPDALQLLGAHVLVASGGKLLGWIEVADRIRPEAGEAMSRLRRMGIRTILLTGDRIEVAKAVGETLKVDSIEAALLPEDKLARVTDLVGRGEIVAMLGDGINDAPALAAASVGVAMGSGTHVTREKADIVLIGNDLGRFVDMVKVARRVRAIIQFNFIGTVLVDLAGIAAAMTGYIGPVEAAAIHTGSELAFILNSARLLPSPLFWKLQELVPSGPDMVPEPTESRHARA